MAVGEEQGEAGSFLNNENPGDGLDRCELLS